MSIRGCFAPSFPPFYTRLPRPDDGAQDPDATFDDDSYYTGGAYYYVQAADDDQE